MTNVVLGVVGVVAAVGGIVAAAGTSESTPLFVGGSVATAAIGTVVWVARKTVNGELVPLPIKQLLEGLQEQNRGLTTMNNELIAAHNQDRELIREATQALYGSTQGLHNVRDYLRTLESLAPLRTDHFEGGPHAGQPDARGHT